MKSKLEIDAIGLVEELRKDFADPSSQFACESEFYIGRVNGKLVYMGWRDEHDEIFDGDSTIFGPYVTEVSNE